MIEFLIVFFAMYGILYLGQISIVLCILGNSDFNDKDEFFKSLSPFVVVGFLYKKYKELD